MEAYGNDAFKPLEFENIFRNLSNEIESFSWIPWVADS